MSHLYWDDHNNIGQRRVLLATTAYDSPDASYTAAIASTRAHLANAGIATAYALLSGNCHVDDARNSIVATFLESDCDELVFLDADVSWMPRDLERLLGHDCDIVGGVYPKRAVGNHDMPVRMLPDVTEPDFASGLIEVEGLPTGFLRIGRLVLETLARDAKTFRKGDDLTQIPLIFERTWRDGIGRIGGDITFGMKAREAGFRCFADSELRLGHAAKVIVHGSLAAALRKQTNKTLGYVADLVRDGNWSPDHIQEAIEYVGNAWGAQSDALVAAIKVLEDKPGPVIETGSGLSTALMAAAVPDHYVYCLEHDPLYALQLRRTAKSAGVKNIGLVEAPIDPETNWYSLKDCEGIPEDRFRLGFCDGPPRVYGSRSRFIKHIAPMCEVIIVDDCNDDLYRRAWLDYAKRRGREIAFEGRIAIVR